MHPLFGLVALSRPFKLEGTADSLPISITLGFTVDDAAAVAKGAAEKHSASNVFSESDIGEPPLGAVAASLAEFVPSDRMLPATEGSPPVGQAFPPPPPLPHAEGNNPRPIGNGAPSSDSSGSMPRNNDGVSGDLNFLVSPQQSVAVVPPPLGGEDFHEEGRRDGRNSGNEYDSESFTVSEEEDEHGGGGRDLLETGAVSGPQAGSASGTDDSGELKGEESFCVASGVSVVVV